MLVMLKSLDFVSLVSCRLLAALVRMPIVPYRLVSWVDRAVLVYMSADRHVQPQQIRRPDVVISKRSISIADKEHKIVHVDDIYTALCSQFNPSVDDLRFRIVDFHALMMLTHGVTSEDEAYDILAYKTREFHGVSLIATDMRSNSVAMISSVLARVCYIPCIPEGISKEGVDFSKSMQLLRDIVKIPVVKEELYGKRP